MDKAVLEDVLTAYKKTLGREVTGPELNIWRIIIKSRIARSAAALLIITAVLIGINQFGGSVDMASVAWGEVLEAMEDVPTVIFEMTNVTTLWENKTISTVSRVYDAGEYGNRVDIYMNGELLMQKYALPNENIAYRIRPKEKMYSHFKLLQDHVATEEDFPRQWVKTILSEDYTHLGSNNVDGFDVEGVEVTNSELLKGDEGLVRLWVDVKTNLPVLIELERWVLEDDVEKTMEFFIGNFQWNVGLNEEFFIPNISDDYVLIEEQKDLPVEMRFSEVSITDSSKYNEIVPGSHFSIFTLGMTKDEVMEILGDPALLFYGEETYTLDDLPSRYYLCYDDISFLIIEGSVREIAALSPFYKVACYDGVSFMLLDDSIIEITALSPFYECSDGLRVGDSERRVKNILGDNYRMIETEWKDFLIYGNQGITFEIHKSNRTVMELSFGPKR
jgi:hypothetical protein